MIRKLNDPLELGPLLYVGLLRTVGLSAHATLHKIGKPQKGQTIFISTRSGAGGQTVRQLAKLEELEAIGSVGGDAEIDIVLDDLGVDSGFNYKTEKFADALRRLTFGRIGHQF
ncbi:hypothetical protein P154DRAFT_592274 [Amniculicola lignicola CBS 123094]|uniref:Alcohol dehydrogenase-like C-terminal domain-containing protein n=1 Tax=Amniculicola lignicola CBS 123094 TaxID=1392246 RepID=A0A6A5VU64_9PLEO|nr:hypothetical protein P154DRAFT_592274 [Amniculicola lignicola CBS 123094]